MSAVIVASAVPDGMYRIRTDQRTPPLYFEWQADNSVHMADLKSESDAQLWKITQVKETGTYTITNVAGNVQLSVQKYTDDGQERTRVFSGGKQEWSLEARVKQFVIRLAEADKCIDLADNNWLIVWDFYNSPNQRFSLEAVVPDVAPGVYSLRNRSTQGVLSVWTGFEQPTAPLRVWPGITNSDYNTWTIAPKRAGYTLKNTKTTLATPRWLADFNGPVVRLRETVCRITRVPGTDFYYVATGMEKDALVLADTNPTATNDGLVSSVELVQGETRQHWEFVLKK